MSHYLVGYFCFLLGLWVGIGAGFSVGNTKAKKR